MENFKFSKDEDGIWNKNKDFNELQDIKIETDEKMRSAERQNKNLFRKKENVFSVIEETDEKLLQTITELRLMIDMMKNDPATDPKVLSAMQEELAIEMKKREELEPRVLEKEDEANFALQKKNNLLN